MSHLEALAGLPELTYLALGKVGSDADLTPVSQQHGIRSLDIFGADKGTPKGLTAIGGMSELELYLSNVDVAAWLRTPDFVPPRVKSLHLHFCALPDDPKRLDFPGVQVVIH